MKKLLIILFILSGNVLVYGQYQSMFGQNETTFMIEYNNTYFEHFLDSFYYSRDTVSFGETYKIIKCNRTGEAWIKEDTTLGKAWVLYHYPVLEDKLIYDLNMQIGDLYQVPGKNTTGIVDSIYYDGGKKHLRFQPYLFVSEPFYMIEGMGLTTSFIFYPGNLAHGLDKITCHFKDGQLNYNWGGPCIPPGAYTNVNELNSEHFNLAPNPSNGHVSLEIPENVKVLEINVLNMQGQVVFHQKGTANELNLSFLEDGNYILHIETSEGFASSKTCIER